MYRPKNAPATTKYKLWVGSSHRMEKSATKTRPSMPSMSLHRKTEKIEVANPGYKNKTPSNNNWYFNSVPRFNLSLLALRQHREHTQARRTLNINNTGNTMCKTNWSRKVTDKLQELFIKTDKKSKLTKFKEKVKLTKGNGQGTCVENTNMSKRRETTARIPKKHVNCTFQS